MKVAFRVDASTTIGSGHIMRCLALASSLESRQVDCFFICSKQPGDFIDYLKQEGQAVIEINGTSQDNKKQFNAEEDAFNTIAALQECNIDIVIVDHYQVAAQWESKIHKYCRKIVAIDDLANRNHDVDILIDQNLYENYQSRYLKRVPDTCELLLGPEFALLRDEYTKINRHELLPRKRLGRILVFYGGMDEVNETSKALNALDYENYSEISVDIVLGVNNPHKEKILQNYAAKENWFFHIQTNKMSELMARADLMLCAGGTTQWERIYMLLPGIVTAVADNQKESCEYLSRSELATFLGFYDSVNVDSIRNSIDAWTHADGNTWHKTYEDLLGQPIGNVDLVVDTILA